MTINYQLWMSPAVPTEILQLRSDPGLDPDADVSSQPLIIDHAAEWDCARDSASRILVIRPRSNNDLARATGR
jgi:hypothetical protein